MHRSRLALLVIVAPVAACSTRKSADGTSPLAQDSSLAHLDLRQRVAVAMKPQLPDACSATTVAAQPAVADHHQATDLTRRAYDAELVGDLQQARTLLQRASALDGTDKSVAYHLGRTSEALGDRTEAVTAYCHYLALAPATADTADVRLRLTRLSQPQTHVASGNTGSTMSRRSALPSRTTRAPAPSASRVMTVASRTARSSRVRLPERDVQSGGVDVQPAGAPVDPSPADVGTHRTTADGDVVATTRSSSTNPQPVSSSARRRGLSRAEGAGIGAAAGAIIAGATGHSVKGAVIGAAAGGILGAVVVGGAR